jgi:hypothetical protein
MTSIRDDISTGISNFNQELKWVPAFILFARLMMVTGAEGFFLNL